jgi:hypothetical protein
MRLVECLSLNLAWRRRWKTFVAISAVIVFFPAGRTLGGSGPSTLLTRPSSGQQTTRQFAMVPLSKLPLDAQSTVSTNLGRDIAAYRARSSGGGIEAENARNKFAVKFTPRGLDLHRGSRRWRLDVRNYGYGGALKAVQTASPEANYNRIEYRRGTLTEWYVNGPAGLEQGITIQKKPARADRGPLTIEMGFHGNLKASIDKSGTGLTLSSREGQAELRYVGLYAYDAVGRKLPAWMEVKGRRLLLKTDDTHARYPVVIDPFVQVAELIASDGVANAELGASVAVSGNTIVAGAPGCTECGFVGAAYVFTEPATGWGKMTQTAKLTASDGVVNNQFGFAVSISGQTIVVGAHAADGSRGAAYVFVEPVGGWTNMTETAKLSPSDGVQGELVGRSVSISGNTVVAGAPQATIGAIKQQGAAYVFVEPSSGWANMTQTAKLTAASGVSFGQLGYSVGIDGNTIVIGSPSPIAKKTFSTGTAYVFVEPTGGWVDMTQTAQLTASDGLFGDRLGNFVAISGNTVVGGAPLASIGSHLQQGAAYVFVQPAGGWASMTQTAKLTSTDGSRRSYFGRAVSISASKVVIGAPNQEVGSNLGEGAVYEFIEPAGGWADATQASELNPLNVGKGDTVGCRVGVDGNTVVAGALGGNKRGTAFIFLDTQ